MGTANSLIILATRRPRKSSYQEATSTGHFGHTCIISSTHSEGNLSNKDICPLQNRKLALKKRKRPFEWSHVGVVGSKALH